MRLRLTPILKREGAELVITFLAAPLSWTLHLLISYALVGAGCATGWGGTRITLAVLTIFFALTSMLSAYGVLREWPRPIHVFKWVGKTEEESPVTNFLLGLGLIVTGFFTLAIVLGGIGALLLPLCEAAHHG
ncbi:MAG: hypothetical protein ACT443_12465 [Gemmatimonadota bacterium]